MGWIVLGVVHHRRWLDSLLLRDLLNYLNTYPSVQIQKTRQFLYHRRPIPRFTVKDVSGQLQLLQVRQLCQLFNIVKLGDFVGVREQVLQSQQFLDVDEVFQSVVVNLQTLDGQFSYIRQTNTFKGIGLKLPHFVVVDVEFLQLFHVFQAVDFVDLVLGGFEDLEFSQLAQVKSVEILQKVVAQVNNLQILK